MEEDLPCVIQSVLRDQTGTGLLDLTGIPLLDCEVAEVVFDWIKLHRPKKIFLDNTRLSDETFGILLKNFIDDNVLTTLSLRDNIAITDTSADKLVEILKNNRTLTTLNLTGNAFSMLAVSSIVSSFRKSLTCKSLCGISFPLHCQSIVDNMSFADGAIVAAELVRKDSSMQYLEVRASKSNDALEATAGLELIVEALQTNGSLLRMKCAGFRITNQTGSILASSLSTNTTLQSLEFALQSPHDTQALAAFAHALEGAEGLTSLRLQGLQVAAGLTSLLHVVRSHRCTLRHLAVFEVTLTASSVRNLVDALYHNTSLRLLRISGRYSHIDRNRDVVADGDIMPPDTPGVSETIVPSDGVVEARSRAIIDAITIEMNKHDRHRRSAAPLIIRVGGLQRVFHGTKAEDRVYCSSDNDCDTDGGIDKEYEVGDHVEVERASREHDCNSSSSSPAAAADDETILGYAETKDGTRRRREWIAAQVLAISSGGQSYVVQCLDGLVLSVDCNAVRHVGECGVNVLYRPCNITVSFSSVYYDFDSPSNTAADVIERQVHIHTDSEASPNPSLLSSSPDLRGQHIKRWANEEYIEGVGTLHSLGSDIEIDGVGTVHSSGVAVVVLSPRMPNIPSPSKAFARTTRSLVASPDNDNAVPTAKVAQEEGGKVGVTREKSDEAGPMITGTIEKIFQETKADIDSIPTATSEGGETTENIKENPMHPSSKGLYKGQDKVQVRFYGDNPSNWYAATVARVSDDGNVLDVVINDDGSLDTQVETSMVRKVDDDAAANRVHLPPKQFPPIFASSAQSGSDSTVTDDCRSDQSKQAGKIFVRSFDSQKTLNVLLRRYSYSIFLRGDPVHVLRPHGRDEAGVIVTNHRNGTYTVRCTAPTVAIQQQDEGQLKEVPGRLLRHVFVKGEQVLCRRDDSSLWEKAEVLSRDDTDEYTVLFQHSTGTAATGVVAGKGTRKVKEKAVEARRIMKASKAHILLNKVLSQEPVSDQENSSELANTDNAALSTGASAKPSEPHDSRDSTLPSTSNTLTHAIASPLDVSAAAESPSSPTKFRRIAIRKSPLSESKRSAQGLASGASNG